MKSSIKTKPSRWDALVAGGVILAALLCAAGVWGGGHSSGLTAVFSLDGKETERVALTGLAPQERSITAGDYQLRLVLTETEIFMEEADCPTQDCVHTGRISKAGQSIVCLPGRFSVQLIGDTKDGVDAVLG